MAEKERSLAQDSILNHFIFVVTGRQMAGWLQSRRAAAAWASSSNSSSTARLTSPTRYRRRRRQRRQRPRRPCRPRPTAVRATRSLRITRATRPVPMWPGSTCGIGIATIPELDSFTPPPPPPRPLPSPPCRSLYTSEGILISFE